MLSKRVNRIKPSPSVQMTLLAQDLKAQGVNVIGLSVGEPDFDTPEAIKQAGIEAINSGNTRYTAVAGSNDLLESIVIKLKRDNGLDYAKNELLVSCGAKHSIMNAMFALLDRGDEVIIPAPYWVSYPDMTKLADATPIIVNTSSDNNYKLTARALRKHLSDNTKMLVLNSPNNPTGAVYSIEELKALADVLMDFPRVIILSDDIYEHIQWSGASFSNIINAEPRLKARVLVVNGVSKSHAMTGWRIGFTAGNSVIIKAMNTLQSQMTTNACSISQQAAALALRSDPKDLTPLITTYKQRHDMLQQRLDAISGFSCMVTQGAFYLFIDVSGAMQKLGFSNDVDFCLALLDKQHVACVPGSAFGMEGHMRISYALDNDSLLEAVARIEQFVKR